MSSNGGDESVNGHRVSAVGTRLTKACGAFSPSQIELLSAD